MTMPPMLDVSRIRALGWRQRRSLKEGIGLTYRWCLENDVFDAVLER